MKRQSHLYVHGLLFTLIFIRVLRIQLAHDSEDEDFDFEAARQQEAVRRLRMLGNLANQSCNPKTLRDRAFDVRVPTDIFASWYHEYRARGLEGLLPDWEPLSPKDVKLVLMRREWLGALADTEIVYQDDIEDRAKELGWKYPQRLQNWLTRYLTDGLWGLSPAHNPKRKHRQQRKKDRKPPRDQALLTDKDWELIDERRAHIGEDIITFIRTGEPVPDRVVRKRAQERDIAPSTLWDYIARYREHGLAGLARQERADKGTSHINPQLQKIIRSVRLSNADIPVRAVWERVCEIADTLGIDRPSRATVRRECDAIPKPVRLLADGRVNQFRNSHRFSGWMIYNGLILQVDHTQIDVLVEDLRIKGVRRKSKLVRPWLTTCIASQSRLLLGAVFSYDQPDRYTVATVIRDALTDLNGVPGGLCDEIWVDHGKDLLSDHVKRITEELGITIWPLSCPEHKGIVERFFGTLNTRVWVEIGGYTNSNTRDRNPNAERRAKLTIREVEEKFWAFITDTYHNEIHSELGVTPLDHWQDNFFIEPIEAELLNALLQRTEPRSVQKDQIGFEGREYWHPDLGIINNEQVVIRAPSLYEPPDEIEVYYDNQFYCRAFAKDSERAEQVTQEDMAKAKRKQMKHYNGQIREAKRDHEAIQQEVHEAQKQQAIEKSATEQTSSVSQNDRDSALDTGKASSTSKKRPSKDSSSKNGSQPQKKESIFHIAARKGTQTDS